jgi:hypothetical protein
VTPSRVTAVSELTLLQYLDSDHLQAKHSGQPVTSSHECVVLRSNHATKK